MPDSKSAPLILVDGSSYLFRAFHALPNLTAPDGHPTGAMLGVMNMLEKMRESDRPERMAVIFDAPGKTFRDEWYPDYKATRAPTPDDLIAQIEPLHALVEALGYPLVCVPGVEADDVIATYARAAAAEGCDVLISTGDKDLAQLVDARITLVNTMNDSRLDRAAVIAKFGVPPECIVDYLALIGDSVDNVPGVDKVGPKTAAKWLNEHGSLDAILAKRESFGGKIGENLRAAADRLPLSRRLVTVRDDVSLVVPWKALELGPRDPQRLHQMASRFGLTGLLRQLGLAPDAANRTAVDTTSDAAPFAAESATSVGTKSDHSVDFKVEVVHTMAALKELCTQLEAADEVAFDTETTALDPMRAELVGMSFAIEPDGGWYLPLAHRARAQPAQHDALDEAAPPAEPGAQVGVEAALQQLRHWLESAAHAKVGHHLKYDRCVLANHGVALGGIRDDSLLESYVLDAATHRHDLDSLAARHLGYRTTTYEDVAGKGAKQIPFAEVPIETAAPYAVEDAVVSLRLHRHFQARLHDQPGPARIYRELEMPLIEVLGDIERTGVSIDVDELARQGEALGARLAAVEARAHETAGEPFNLGSPKQIQEILFERLGLPVLRKTPKGQPSTAEDVLEQMAADHDLPALILEHRGLSKLISTYVEKLPRLVHPRTGRVHTSYQQAVAATGRLSSTDPNLQNIPIRSEDGRRIRKAFVAPEGFVLLSADYSQIELRLMAHFSGDERLLAAFRAGEDIHRATAAEVFETPLAEVTEEQRRAAKAVNFGLIYGISAFGLARNLSIEQREAREIMERYFTRYAGVKKAMDEAREAGRDRGRAETLWGRRLALPDIDSRNAARRAQAERIAINAPLQGTAADIIKCAMIHMHAGLRDVCADARMILQVHDELVFEVPRDAVDRVSSFVRETMEGAASLDVDLVVDVGVGADWAAAH